MVMVLTLTWGVHDHSAGFETEVGVDFLPPRNASAQERASNSVRPRAPEAVDGGAGESKGGEEDANEQFVEAHSLRQYARSQRRRDLERRGLQLPDTDATKPKVAMKVSVGGGRFGCNGGVVLADSCVSWLVAPCFRSWLLGHGQINLIADRQVLKLTANSTAKCSDLYRFLRTTFPTHKAATSSAPFIIRLRAVVRLDMACCHEDTHTHELTFW